MKKCYCNLCGKEMDFWDIQEEFSIQSFNIGYGSKHDGDALELDLCCDCMDELIDRCKINPITSSP